MQFEPGHFPTPVLRFRAPQASDAAEISLLLKESGAPTHSELHRSLLQSDQFRETCGVVEIAGDIVGWISAYLPPFDPESLYVWQIAVSKKARGLGVAHRMLLDLMNRDICDGVRRLQISIRFDDPDGWEFIQRYADIRGASMAVQANYLRDVSASGLQPTEHLVTVNFAQSQQQKAA